MEQIRFASFLGDNAFEFYQAVVAHVGEVTGLPLAMLAQLSGDQEAMFGAGEVEAAFSCGLPYVGAQPGASLPVTLLAAPVMPGPRYADRPVYYSDVIVRADAPFQSFADLRGASFAYNQTASFSGFVMPCHHLLQLGETLDYFGGTAASGSHAQSMDWVETGRADCAAIDSVVLEMEWLQRPERAQTLRVVESIGPAGMPPVIAARRLDDGVRQALSQALIEMHTTAPGSKILNQGGIRRFASVSDSDYYSIARMAKAVREAKVFLSV